MTVVPADLRRTPIKAYTGFLTNGWEQLSDEQKPKMVRPQGSGLGIWKSRGPAASPGSELVVDAKPGCGSTFRFTLPLIDLDKLQHT